MGVHDAVSSPSFRALVRRRLAVVAADHCFARFEFGIVLGVAI